jgi:cytochrome c551/c552
VLVIVAGPGLEVETMRLHLLAFALVSTAALLACGGSQPQPPAQPAPSVESDAAAPSTSPAEPASVDAGGAAHSAAAEPEFDDLPMDKKVEVMATKVVPHVGKLFKEYDGKKYEKFGCVSCHGPQKKDDPRKVLPKLTLSNGGFEKLAKAKPEMMKFMGEKVVPTMAAALNEKPFDPATKKGFGCGGCHAID